MNMSSNGFSQKMRKWFRIVHRDLSFVFSGIIMIYAISGIALNHKRDFNSDYRITRSEIILKGDFPNSKHLSKEEVLPLLEQVGEDRMSYMKHYYFEDQQMKVFLKGGSSLEVDMNTGKALYESVKKRPVLSALNRLHYNPIRWWTWFSDIFAISLIVITITGLFMNKGKKGFMGRGGIEFVIGILIPILFLIYLS